MTTENTLITSNSIKNTLNMVKELLADQCGFSVTNLKQHTESSAYGACSYVLNGKTVQQRISKITPTKTGQFVSIWKRNNEGITEPFDSSDNIDFIVILSKSGDNLGLFIFPKMILINNGIISRNGKGGKRGIRVYPPWDNASNKQAEKTQGWQTNYFFTIKNNANNIDLIKKLFAPDKLLY